MSCLATYWVRSYTELFICRVLTGISIGGAAPVIFSLLADYWPGSSRVKMNTLVGIAMSAGIAGGQVQLLFSTSLDILTSSK
jgi:MFS family permease